MKYPFTVHQEHIKQHTFWVAESLNLKGCVGQGNTIFEAVQELEENEDVWLETAFECGIDIPPQSKRVI